MKRYLLSLLLLTTACAKNVIEPQNANSSYTGYNATALLSNATNDVILGTYKDLDRQTATLAIATAALQANPSAVALEAARQAYRAARAPWEATEAFAFGPVSTLGLDGVIDTWLLNRNSLAAILASPTDLTASRLRELEGGLQGFHPIEFLLFGEDTGKAAAELTPRELAYLAASADNLHAATGRLLRAWQPTSEGGQGFAAQLAGAGPGNARYASQKTALQELVGGMSAAATELANSKVERPLTTNDLTFEEARFSRNSLAEFSQNLRGIENLYLGRYGAAGSGVGLGAFVQTRNPTLDATFRQQLAAAQTAITSLPGRFDEAIRQNPAAVRALQARVREVQATIDGPVAGLINNL